ncbi:MAG: hypothetical protein BWK80_00065 [Desulfobacteraceae bacterium IS3]|nr:MAG: hypothetical protein BWK80_00065 [Desulfobacteraceae bacterium IS3]
MCKFREKYILIAWIAIFILACTLGGMKPVFSAEWAKPLSAAGLPNFFRVSETLYRSAQPSQEGMQTACRLGIKTVINLRSSNSDRDIIKGLDLKPEHIKTRAWNPKIQDVVKFLKIVSVKENGPFLVHCKHGADRTGLMCAMYRIIIQGRDRQQAVDEMLKGGFGFHQIWGNIIEFIKNSDIEAIKKELFYKKILSGDVHKNGNQYENTHQNYNYSFPDRHLDNRFCRSLYRSGLCTFPAASADIVPMLGDFCRRNFCFCFYYHRNYNR